MTRLYRGWWGGVLATLLWIAGGRPAVCEPLLVAAANSYLEAALRDLLGTEVDVVRLTEPGQCPGHFDLRPSQIRSIQRCRVWVRFDFQAWWDDHLKAHNKDLPSRIVVQVPGGLSIPATYGAVCRQLLDHLVRDAWLTEQRAEMRWQQIAQRLKELEDTTRRQVQEAGLRGIPVISSVHQQAFCEWLGFRVVGTLRTADATAVSELNTLVRAARESGVRWVIANRPEGKNVADSLAMSLGAAVIVLDNFPVPHHQEPWFDQMVQANVKELVSAMQKP